MAAAFRSWLQYRQGILDEEQWETEVAVLDFLMTHPRVRLWWQRTGNIAVNRTFAEFVEANFTDSPASNELYENVAEWSNDP